jgi:sugar lactone lactonase YvrE
MMLMRIRPTRSTPCPFPLHFLPMLGQGPEDVAINLNGHLIVGLAGGWIMQIDPHTQQQQCIANTGGRPLGIECLPNNNLIVCDAERGLLHIDVSNGHVTVLVSHYQGQPLRFCNNASVARDGTIYFSQSTTRYGLAEFRRDLIDDRPTGRLFRLRPQHTAPELLCDGLAFANGVALSADESFVVVAESGRNRLKRYDLRGAQQGRLQPFGAALAGMPDNLSVDDDGLFWLAIASPTDTRLDQVRQLPFAIRHGLGKLQQYLPIPTLRRVQVQAFDQAGYVVHDWCWQHPKFHMVTGIRRAGRTLYLASLAESSVMAVDVSDI